MEIGIGLPSTVPGATGRQITEWARAAEQAGFSTLGTIDRIVYPNYEPMTALAAAAAVTERIRLATTVLLGPLRVNVALVAKQALSLDALAGGGRTVLGLAVGGREDDFAASGVRLADRGRWMDDAVGEIRRIWNGTYPYEIGPRPQGAGPSLLLGGSVNAAYERAASHGDGWIMGGGTPEMFRQSVESLHAAWRKRGRDGEPRKSALAYYALGEHAERDAERYLGDYYGFLGTELTGMIVGSAAKDAQTVQGYLSAFEAAGCDELIFFPSSSDPEQVRLLAAAAGL